MVNSGHKRNIICAHENKFELAWQHAAMLFSFSASKVPADNSGMNWKKKKHTLLPIRADIKPPDRVDLIPPQFALTLCRPIYPCFGIVPATSWPNQGKNVVVGFFSFFFFFFATLMYITQSSRESATSKGVPVVGVPVVLDIR